MSSVGLVTRSVDPGPPVAVAYALTASGEELQPVLQELGRWALENLADVAHR